LTIEKLAKSLLKYTSIRSGNKYIY